MRSEIQLLEHINSKIENILHKCKNTQKQMRTTKAIRMVNLRTPYSPFTIYEESNFEFGSNTTPFLQDLKNLQLEVNSLYSKLNSQATETVDSNQEFLKSIEDQAKQIDELRSILHSASKSDSLEGKENKSLDSSFKELLNDIDNWVKTSFFERKKELTCK